LDLVPEDTTSFTMAGKMAGLTLSNQKEGSLIQGEDRTGAIGYQATLRVGSRHSDIAGERYVSGLRNGVIN
jgi:hypothetical protein